MKIQRITVFIFLLLSSCEEESGPSLAEQAADGTLVGEFKAMGITDSQLEEANIIGTVVDVEGNSYKWVQIGTQRWMAENLRTTTYADGTDLPPLSFSPSYLPSFGTMYTIGGAGHGQTSDSNPSSAQGVCPSGWHLPSKAEWEELMYELGENVAIRLKTNAEEPGDLWTVWQPYTNGNNLSGFAAMPGGYGVWENENMRFEDVYDYAVFRTSDPQIPYGGHGYYPFIFGIYFSYDYTFINVFESSTAHVRCVKNEE